MCPTGLYFYVDELPIQFAESSEVKQPAFNLGSLLALSGARDLRKNSGVTLPTSHQIPFY